MDKKQKKREELIERFLVDLRGVMLANEDVTITVERGISKCFYSLAQSMPLEKPNGTFTYTIKVNGGARNTDEII